MEEAATTARNDTPRGERLFAAQALAQRSDTFLGVESAPASAGPLWWAPPRNYAAADLSEESSDAQPSAARPADRSRLTQHR